MGDWSLSSLLGRQDGGCLFGVWDRIALHCMYRENGNDTQAGQGKWESFRGSGGMGSSLSLPRCLLVSGYDLVMRKRAFGVEVLDPQNY